MTHLPALQSSTGIGAASAAPLCKYRMPPRTKAASPRSEDVAPNPFETVAVAVNGDVSVADTTAVAAVGASVACWVGVAGRVVGVAATGVSVGGGGAGVGVGSEEPQAVNSKAATMTTKGCNM